MHPSNNRGLTTRARGQMLTIPSGREGLENCFSLHDFFSFLVTAKGILVWVYSRIFFSSSSSLYEYFLDNFARTNPAFTSHNHSVDGPSTQRWHRSNLSKG